PGTAQLPPFVIGNSTSTTRCPVSSGAPASSRRRYGRGRRPGHAEVRLTSVPEAVAITASPGAGPASRIFSTTPLSAGGTGARDPIPPETATDPRLAPSPTAGPGSVCGVNSNSAPAAGVNT